MVVEVRNKTWIGKDLLNFLAEHKSIFALTDQEWMPKPKDLWEKHGTALLTGPASYIRLLGERKRIEALTKTWDKLVIDRTSETRDVITVIRQLMEKTTVATLINNHFGGYAVASIEMLEKLWNETP